MGEVDERGVGEVTVTVGGGAAVLTSSTANFAINSQNSYERKKS
jgi:hypothetical protein